MNRSPKRQDIEKIATLDDVELWRTIMRQYPDGHPEIKKIQIQIDEALARIGKLENGRKKNQSQD